MNTRFAILFFFIWTICIPVQAMVYDNRFFPLYWRPYTRTICKPSSLFADIIIMTAGNATIDADETVGIPEIFGKFDEQNLAQALVLMGKPNPIPDIQGELPWKIKGKIQAEGLAFAWNQHIYKYLSCGMSWFVMHVSSRQLFRPIGATAQLDPDMIEMLDEAMRQMFECIGITATKWDASGMSDIDFYLRLGNIWEYPYKFRRIDAGIKVGVLIPSGIQTDVDNPASVPFGGDGLWGMYVSGDAEFEVREDWNVGLLLRLSQRFSKTKIGRMQVSHRKKEQLLYGAIVGPLEREPGLSYAFTPYLKIEDLREGLGFLVGYSLVGHSHDIFQDRRVVKSTPSSIGDLNLTSDWLQEYVTINLYYDFAKVKNTNTFRPTISFMWDFPVHHFVADKVPRMNRVSLGIEFDY